MCFFAALGGGGREHGEPWKENLEIASLWVPKSSFCSPWRGKARVRRDRSNEIALDQPPPELVTRPALLAAGVTSAAIEHRLATGRLHPVLRGVYAVAPPPLQAWVRERAALLAAGPRAVLSHRSAAVVWGLVSARDGAAVHVTVPGSRRHPRPDLIINGCDLPSDRVRRREGLRVTCPVRTLHDLAASDPRELPQAVDEALVRQLALSANLVPARGRRGAAALRAVARAGVGPTRSEAERILARLVARARLPRPQTNVRLAGHEVDALWSAQRLVVEVDGYDFHARRDAFERDRRRDGDLLAQGYRVLRVSWRQLTAEPEAVAARLAATLASSPPASFGP